jgi:uncharacterized 2Fe-2S/4Fe-4S cluster protein (DUF4445 family)
MPKVVFNPGGVEINVPVGSLIQEAARKAGIEIGMPCGGQGRCGRCAVIVESGPVRRRSTMRLSAADVQAGYALACQTVVDDDTVVAVPPQEKLERRLTSDKSAAQITLPFPYDYTRDQTVRTFYVRVDPPTYADNTDDFARLSRALAAQHGLQNVRATLGTLRRLSEDLRAADWDVTAVIEMGNWLSPDGPPRLIGLLPGYVEATWGLAIDIGTTSNVVYLVNLETGDVVDTAADYNGQIARGEDVISRIIYANKEGGLGELQSLVIGTLNRLIERVCRRQHIEPEMISKVVVAGNTTMMHLLLALPPEVIRKSPFVPTINHIPPLVARDIGLKAHPEALLDCLPGVASYVGADITAGIVASGLDRAGALTMFIDIGTNGEIVLGDGSWLISCACSAGPAFEGAGVQFGMRATAGAIEEIWIDQKTLEPTIRVIGKEKPRGICGSGLIALVSEMFVTGVVDKGGNFNVAAGHPRIRSGDHGGEYVVVWGSETADGRDIVITKVDVDSLLRTKAAIYAGFSVLATSVGLQLSDVQDFVIAGAFGQYINIEKAIQIGLLPDMPWDRFKFLGNTSVLGAYMALLSPRAREQIAEAASKLTYLELSADNSFYDQFTSALFLPHTDIAKFPSVQEALLVKEPTLAD